MEIQAQEVKTRVIGAGSHYTIATMANVQEAQEPGNLSLIKWIDNTTHEISTEFDHIYISGDN